MDKRIINIAIDGPAAGGKTTVARLVASRLGLLYLDTGMMYRATAWQALQKGCALDSDLELGRLAEAIDMRLEPDISTSAGCRVFVDGLDISGELHGPAVNGAVSKVASSSPVRAEMVKRQKAIAEAGGIVMAGRDICTVVLPEAELKYFLDATLEERARRRLSDMQSRPGNTLTYDDIYKQLAARDYEDTHRSDSPLQQAPDASYIDCTHLSAEAVADIICQDYAEASRVNE
ncbi:MAG: (d)CMP kinase [Candidatus Bruticola sp.]